MKKLLLNKFHEQAGAEFSQVQEYLIPAHYGSVSTELNCINQRVALLDRSYLGKVSIKGSDALDLLNRISTNDLQYLSVGTMCDTVFVTPKGRMVDYCRVVNTGDELLLISSFFRAQHLIEWINRFVFFEDIEIQNASDDYIWMILFGPMAKIFLRGFTKKPITDMDEAIWLNVEDSFFPALENTNFKIPAYNFCIEKKAGPTVVSILSAQLKSLQGNLIGDNAFQIIRVESGMPDYGTEITQDYNPHEARLTQAISFTKGCYTGQEVIARLDTYDKVQKYLMIIELNDKLSTPPPLEIFIEDESVGHLTSYAYDPITKKSVGLGYIKKMYTIDNDIYVEIQTEKNRISANLKLPPQAYSENK